MDHFSGSLNIAYPGVYVGSLYNKISFQKD